MIRIAPQIENHLKNWETVIKNQPKEMQKFNKKLFWNLFLEISKIEFEKIKKHQDDKFIIDQRNEKIIYTILGYFLQLENFNQYGLIKNKASLDKGLLIYGDYGVGKSFLFKVLQDMGRKIFTEYNNNSFYFKSISTGSFVDEYMTAVKSNQTNFEIKNYYTGKLYIDDLGFEKLAFLSFELLGEVLFERNRNQATTFVTTNLKPSEITERYKERIGDRLPEMFNIIKWEGVSFRK